MCTPLVLTASARILGLISCMRPQRLLYVAGANIRNCSQCLLVVPQAPQVTVKEFIQNHFFTSAEAETDVDHHELNVLQMKVSSTCVDVPPCMRCATHNGSPPAQDLVPNQCVAVMETQAYCVSYA